MTLVTISDIRVAAERIAASVVRTPLIAARFGASATMPRPLARATRAAGLQATILMPDSSPAVKVDRTRELGAEVVLVPAEQREAATDKLIAERGATLVHPYDNAHMIAGHGTIGMEVAADLPEVAAVLVPVSGGALIAGVATAMKALRPDVRVIGVEPDLAADLAEGFHAGRRVAWPIERTSRTIADGLRLGSVGELPWRHITAYVDDVFTVTESEIENATRRLALESRLVAEPSGAVATAAYLHRLHRRHRLPDGPVVAIVTGGNVAPELLSRVLAS